MSEFTRILTIPLVKIPSEFAHFCNLRFVRRSIIEPPELCSNERDALQGEERRLPGLCPSRRDGGRGVSEGISGGRAEVARPVSTEPRVSTEGHEREQQIQLQHRVQLRRVLKWNCLISNGRVVLGEQQTDHDGSDSRANLADFCSELEEVYEQLSKWLEDPIVADESRELDARDRAVVRFAGSLLKRALSESFAGVPVQEGEPQPFIDSNDVNQRHKLALAVRSLSLELARQKNRRQQSVRHSRFLRKRRQLSPCACDGTAELERDRVRFARLTIRSRKDSLALEKDTPRQTEFLKKFRRARASRFFYDCFC